MAGSASDQGPVQKVVGIGKIEVQRDWATLLAVSRPGVAKVEVKTEVDVKTEVASRPRSRATRRSRTRSPASGRMST